MENVRYLVSLWRFWAALAIVGALTWLFHMIAPAEHNPWKPMHLDDPIGLATYRKFTHLKHNREACFRALDEAGVQYTPLADEVTGENCGFRGALTLDRTLTPYSRTVSLTCPMAAALYVWERQSARPLAEELLGSPVARIETYGAYSCRNITGTQRRSQHATANAIDISGIRLADGRLVDVEDHWHEDSAESDYLHAIHDTACRLFSVTLGPDYNAAHADHFHLDFGSVETCR
ncbi:MAG: extensin family protein [Pseudomonadota bacterium]